MDFFNNLAKFFGGLVGDEETNAGVAVHAPDESMKSAYESRIPLPFTYTDDDSSVRSGIMYVPFYAKDDINNELKKNDNSEAIQFYNIELDDGRTLGYNEGKDFLNSLSPDRFKFQTQAIRSPNEEEYGRPAHSAGTDTRNLGKATVKNEAFMENLRKAMQYTKDHQNEIKNGDYRSQWDPNGISYFDRSALTYKNNLTNGYWE